MSGIKRITDLPESSRPYTGEEKLLIVQDGFTITNTFNSLTNYLSAQLYTDSKATLASLSGNWQNTYTTVASNSANWQNSFRTATGGISANNNTIVREALVGDVTALASSNTTTISNNVITNAKLADMAEATFKGRLSGGTGDPQDLSVSQVQSLVVTPSAVQTALSADPEGARDAMDATNYERRGLYDRFDDLTRYQDGATLTTGVTLTKTGQPWHLHYTVGGVENGARVVNGKLQLNRNSGYYLGANATLEDVANWSMGVEFIREPSFLAATSSNNFTLAFGPPNIVLANGSGIQISGNPHINMNENGVTSVNMNFGSYDATVQGDAGTNIFTSVGDHGLESNDLVSLGTVLIGNNGGLLPSGIPASGGGTATFGSTSNYYVIKLSSNTFSLALNRGNVLSATVVPLGSNGTQLRVARAAECLNRVYANDVHAWLAPVATNYLVQGSASVDTLITSYNHSIVTNDVIMLEGADLPDPLQERTPYYAIYFSANSIQVSDTRNGSAIPLTENGSPNQLLRTMHRTLDAMIPYGRRSIVTFRVSGDFFQVSLEGVGSVEYYYRDLAMKIPKAMSFYWQSPGASFGASNYHSTYSATAIWVDAPQVEEQHTRRLPAWLSTSGDSTTIANRLTVVDSKRGIPFTHAYPNVRGKMASVAGAASVTPLGGSVNSNVGGCFFADGNFVFNPGFTEFNNANQMAIGCGSVDAQIDTFVSSSAGSLSAVLKSISSISGLTVGSMEEYELCGYMTGTNAKRILLNLDDNPGFTTIFDSNIAGTPLDALTVPWRLKILRKETVAYSHVMYSTLEYNGTIIGPQRMAVDVAADFRNIQIKLITADVNGLVLETIRKTVHPVKLR